MEHLSTEADLYAHYAEGKCYCCWLLGHLLSFHAHQKDSTEKYCICLQFRALSDQLYRSSRYYAELRRAAVEHLREHADMYGPYVEGDFEDYCRSMAKDGSWGDHVTLQVGASALMLTAKLYHASPSENFE